MRRIPSRMLALILTLALLMLLLPGCGKPEPSAPTDAPNAVTPTAAPELTQAPTPEEEEIVYVPSYEVYPPSMAPGQVNFPLERSDGVWFIRLEMDGDEIHYPLMHGGPDAENEPLQQSGHPL